MSRRTVRSSPPKRRFRAALPPLCVFLLAVLVYANTAGNGFVYDDRTIIERNPALRTLDGIPRLFATPYWTGEGRSNRLYRPFTVATYALNWSLGGGKPSLFHVTNVLLHGLAAVLLYLLLGRLFRLPRLSLAASALFAVHPALTESVAGLVGRAEILSGIFVLAGLALDRAGAPRRAASWTGSLACFALALLSKENALAFPGLVLLTDLLVGRPEGVSRGRRAREILALLAVAGAYLVLRARVLGSLMETSAIPGVDNLLVSVPAGRRILTALALAGKYLGLFLWPVPLSADYSARQIEPVTGLGDPRSWLGLGLAAMVAFLIVRYRRRAVPLSWGLGFASVSIFLVSNVPFPIGTIFAERLLYLPLAGLCTSAGLLACAAAEKRPRTVLAAAGVVLILCSARTWARNRDWKDDFALFRSAVRTSPRSARVHYNLGNAYRRRGDLPRAERNYRECLSIYPDFDPARRNLGVVLSSMGRGEEAVAFFEDALQKRPDSASLHNNLGNAYRGLGRTSLAEAEYTRALELDPSSADAHNNLGVLFHERHDWDRARKEYEEAVRLGPDQPAFRVNLGNLLLQRGDSSGAERVFREAVRREPSLAEPHRGLGEALLGKGDTLGAEKELRRSLALDPDQWEAPALLGYLHQQRGEEAEAISFYGESLSRNAQQPELEKNLGILYASRPGGEEQALEHLRRCLALHPSETLAREAKSLVEKLEGRKAPER